MSRNLTTINERLAEPDIDALAVFLRGLDANYVRVEGPLGHFDVPEQWVSAVCAKLSGEQRQA